MEHYIYYLIIKNMKELKIKTLWAVDNQNGVQWGAFRYKREAIAFAKRINCTTIVKRKCITDKY